MGTLTWGEHDGKGENTPTLRQYAKSVESIAKETPVTIIFFPNKFPNYTLVCDGKFRVSIPEGSELYDLLEVQIEQVIADETYLVVGTQLESARKGVFTLGVNTNENTVWEKTTWGITGKVKNKAKAKARGQRRKSVPE